MNENITKYRKLSKFGISVIDEAFKCDPNVFNGIKTPVRFPLSNVNRIVKNRNNQQNNWTICLGEDYSSNVPIFRSSNGNEVRYIWRFLKELFKSHPVVWTTGQDPDYFFMTGEDENI